MNGRMYDPVIGRVLSPDKVVHALGYTQSYNRYSYCMNNPLRYTDPSGRTAFATWTDFYNEVNYLWNHAGGTWNSSSGTSFAGNEGEAMQGAVNAISESNGWGNTSFPNGAHVVKHDIRKINTGMTWYVNGDGIKYATREKAVTYEFKPQLSLGNHIDGLNISTPGTPVPEWISWGNTFVNTAGFGAIRAGGSAGMLRSSGAFRYFANAWTGSQYIKTYNLAKLGTGIGYGTSAVGFILGYYQFKASDQSWGDYGHLGISFLSSGLTINVVTTPIGIGISVIDLLHGFDWFYDDLDSQQQFYNITGGIIFPLNGIPYYFQLRKP